MSLEAPPEKAAEQPEAADDTVLTVLEHLQGAQAAVAQVEDGSQRAYDAIMDGKLAKMTGTAAGFKRGAGQGEKERCASCWHYAQFPARARKAVQKGACELVRPDDGPSVEGEDRCRFYTPDGVNFPYRQES